MELGAVEVFDTLSGCLNLSIYKTREGPKEILLLTLIASVRIAAITSRDPPKT